MIKVIAPSSFSFDQPIMSLVDLHSNGIDSAWMQKSAAVMTKEMSELKPEPGITFVHMLALGDMEAYGVNRNGDGFPKTANENYHDTFVKYAQWYHNHKNKPHLGHPSYGFVKMSAYNAEMCRVELIVGIDEKKDPDSIQKLASGNDLSVSMACTVPFDRCTICDNHAKKKDEYCIHVKEAVTQFTEDGRQIGMINDQPNFFDISKVRRNADRIAFSLRKVASTGGADVTLSVDMARVLGITEPFALIKDSKLRERIEFLSKLAELEKEVEGELQGDSTTKNIAETIQESPGDIPEVDSKDFKAVLGKLTNANVSLPIGDFFKLLMGSRFSEVEDDIPSAKSALSDIFSDSTQDPVSFMSGVDNYEPLDKGVPNMLKDILETVSRSGSLDSGPVGGRVQITILRKKASTPSAKVAVTPIGRCLAEEYAKYKFAFVERVKNPFVIKMALLQNKY